MSLADLGTYIDRGIPEDFVKVYLTCMAQGFSLSCPVDQKVDGLTDKWAKILAKYRGEFTDEFCDGVAQVWMGLLASCDLNSPDYELQLIKAAGVSMDDLPSIGSQEPSQKTAKVDIPQPTAQPKDPLTKPEISPAYRERQQAEAVSLPELNRLNGVYEKAFKSKNPIDFLVAHLTYAKHGTSKTVPKSTVPQHIREGWESIIAKEFGTIASDDFLEVLTNEWFYLVNQKGIPLTTEDQTECLVTFLAKTKQPQAGKSPKKQSLFKKLFGS